MTLFATLYASSGFFLSSDTFLDLVSPLRLRSSSGLRRKLYLYLGVNGFPYLLFSSRQFWQLLLRIFALFCTFWSLIKSLGLFLCNEVNEIFPCRFLWILVPVRSRTGCIRYQIRYPRILARIPVINWLG